METTNDKRARLVELLHQASCGSEQAFAELYKMTNAYLYHVALRIVGTPAHAEEVLQEAYLSIWQEARQYRPELGSAMTWLITIVRNKAVSTLRSQSIDRRSFSIEGDDEVLDALVVPTIEETDALRTAFYSAAKSRLNVAIALLPPTQRQAITLNFFLDMPHTELSAHFGVPLGTVKSWVRRGMARLNDHLCDLALAPPSGDGHHRTGGGRGFQHAA